MTCEKGRSWLGSTWGGLATYVDTPELLHGIESNDFLEQVIPVITLYHMVS